MSEDDKIKEIPDDKKRKSKVQQIEEIKSKFPMHLERYLIHIRVKVDGEYDTVFTATSYSYAMTLIRSLASGMRLRDDQTKFLNDTLQMPPIYALAALLATSLKSKFRITIYRWAWGSI